MRDINYKSRCASTLTDLKNRWTDITSGNLVDERLNESGASNVARRVGCK
jgi:hypothetical protein